jgi:pimeloyl-ACP methyl ester carboxylesterase
MAEVEVPAGVIEYDDTGGDGPVVVLLHGLVMSGTVWRHVVADLRADHRCVTPTLPLGAHRRPMRADADLTLHGLGTLVGDFLAALDLTDVTLVGNDWGGAQLLADHPRVARLGLVACEAFDNYPPGVPGNLIRYACMVPGGLTAVLASLRVRALRRLPFTFGGMSKRGVPDPIMDAWFRPVTTDPLVRRDVGKYVRSARPGQFVPVTEALRDCDRPALVVWALEDRLMPVGHGRRLAELLPKGRLVELSDTRTLVPEDRPADLAAALRAFVAET